MSKLRDFVLGDAIYVGSDLRDDDWEQFAKFGMATNLDKLAMLCYTLPGAKWTFANDYPLVVGGFIPQRHGVVASWFLASRHAWKEHGLEVSKMAAERLQFAHASGVHRIETLCLASRKLAQRWYKSIGLEFESTLKGFCVDGSDAVLFVSTKGGT